MADAGTPAGLVALVSGGASGLGAATVRAFAARGYQVVVLDLVSGRGAELAAQCGGLFTPADVTHTASVAAAFDAVVERYGRLDVLVSCAGVGWAMRTVQRDGSPHDIDAFRRVISINLVGTMDVAGRAAALMAHNEPDADGSRGVIVMTASIAAFDGQIGQAAYAASKGGIVGLTLPMARDLATIGVRVMTIAPGLVDTPIYAQIPADAYAVLQAVNVFPKRMGRPEEFATLVLSIVDNSFLNGETIRFDGATRLPPR